MKNCFFRILPPWILLCLVVGSTFLSCRPLYDETPVPGRERVAGRVLEFGTNVPIPDAEVTLSAWSGSPSGGSAGAVGSVFTDAEGRYSFTGFDPQAALLVNARKAGYFTDLDTEEGVNDGSYDKTDIHLPPYAWLKVTLRNESGAYEFVSSFLNELHPRIQLEQGADSVLVKLVKGNQESIFIYSIRLEPDVYGYSETLRPFCIGHDTTHLTITY